VGDWHDHTDLCTAPGIAQRRKQECFNRRRIDRQIRGAHKGTVGLRVRPDLLAASGIGDDQLGVCPANVDNGDERPVVGGQSHWRLPTRLVETHLQSRWNIGSSATVTGERSGLAAMTSLIIAHQRCMISFCGRALHGVIGAPPQHGKQ
jgi:hypothetical protein